MIQGLAVSLEATALPAVIIIAGIIGTYMLAGLDIQICGKGLKGEKEARAHASETGHVEFGEY